MRTPHVDVGGTNLRKELLRFMTLPILNPEDSSHYLPQKKSRRYIEVNNVTADELRKMIPNSKHGKDKDWEERREKDKGRTWEATKVRETTTCKVCGAIRCLFSKSAVGSKNGPTKEELKRLQLSIAKSWICLWQ